MSATKKQNTIVVVNAEDTTFLQKVSFSLEKAGFEMTEHGKSNGTEVRVFSRVDCDHLWNGSMRQRECSRCTKKEIFNTNGYWEQA